MADPRALSGFWGVPTSSVDWCEKNYEHSRYVCELFNTVSSLAMVVVGLLGFWLHRKSLEQRFLFAFLSVAVVGVGSVAFHGTLRFELQMLDELPMLYTASLLVYILLENRPERRFGAWFPSALVAYAALATYLCAFTRGKLQFYLFQASFSALEYFGLYLVYRVFRASQDSIVRRLFGVGVGLYALALVGWSADLHACSFFSVTLPGLGLPNPELHAFWHVLVSLGLYRLILLIARDRARVLGRDSALAFLGPFPYLRAAPRAAAH